MFLSLNSTWAYSIINWIKIHQIIKMGKPWTFHDFKLVLIILYAFSLPSFVSSLNRTTITSCQYVINNALFRFGRMKTEMPCQRHYLVSVKYSRVFLEHINMVHMWTRLTCLKQFLIYLKIFCPILFSAWEYAASYNFQTLNNRKIYLFLCGC